MDESKDKAAVSSEAKDQKEDEAVPEQHLDEFKLGEKRVEALGGARLDSRRTPIASMGSAADVSDSRHLKAPCPEAVSERFARPMARPRAPGEECPRRAQL